MALGDISASELLIFWAKTSRDSAAPRTYHPLLCHMVDVAAVTLALWQEVLSPAARRSLANALLLSENDAPFWVAFWAGLHDIGKASPAFALRDPATRQRLVDLGWKCPNTVPEGKHGVITAIELPAILKRFGLPSELADRVARVVGGHHGVFPRSSEVVNTRVDAIGRGQWGSVRFELAQWLGELLHLPTAVPQGKLENGSAMFLAGMVSVADWIGSAEEHFQHAIRDDSGKCATNLDRYAEVAAQRSFEALQRLGWIGWSPSYAPRTFADLFPKTPAPRPLQKEVVSLAESIECPSLVLIEAPMGDGKTEAAMYLADLWNAKFGQRGCYFALPTQATSNQMFGRVAEFLTERYSASIVNILLLHGHASLSAEFRQLRSNADRLFSPNCVYGDTGEDGTPANLVAAEWFTHRKRGLLAPFGVGTVDQALLAALQTRHVFVRLFGLAHKVVIVDEVHAYDAYMTTLLERLLEWLAALGSSVALLSATLPASRRRSLANAYRKGLGVAGRAERMNDAAYPRVSWVSATEEGARSVGTSPLARRKLKLSWIDGRVPDAPGLPFELGERLRVALEGGGCAAVICNTVGRAQEVYRALKPYFPGDASDGRPPLNLLHARFPYEEREKREKLALARFGKLGSKVEVGDGEVVETTRPDRAVLVATQIIEQSLDLDFDLMVTDIAPIDLVLQRVGRLQRHDRVRPVGLEKPELWLCVPEEVDQVPFFGKGSEKVYDPHILLRTWLELRERDDIFIPEEVEQLIEAVYDDRRSCPATASATLCARWQETWDRLSRKKVDYESKAREYRILPPGYPDDILEDFNRELEEDDPGVHTSLQALTRLGDPTVNVVLLPKGAWSRLAVEAEPTIAEAAALLRRSVTLQHRSLVAHLLREKGPPSWRRSTLLRHHRLAELADDGKACLGDHDIQLDEELGVCIRRTGEEGE